MTARLAMAAAVLLATLVLACDVHAEECELYTITGYAASMYPGWTADESTTTVGALSRGEAIAAASWNVPMGATVTVEGLGTYRVADRGLLGPRHIDVLVWTVAEAYAITRTARVCIE